MNRESHRLDPGDSLYPTTLNQHSAEAAPPSIDALGNLNLLTQKKVALFCSVKCPAKLILQTHDILKELVNLRLTVIGGFHSPVERECLRILLRGTQPVIITPARSLVRMRIRAEHKEPLENARLLFLSISPSNRHRADAQLALRRNRFVAAVADKILVLHAAPSSKMEQFCYEILSWQKPVYTLDNETNTQLVALGARPVTAEQAGLLA